MKTTPSEPNFRRAALLMTVTSFLVPLGGLVTAPILARALGDDGRGEMAAALAPGGLLAAAATFGLPDALTFHIAKRPSLTRHGLIIASALTVVLGLVCVAITVAVLPFLSAGNADLGRLILFATAGTVPALVGGVFRGAAMGRQMWRTVAAERVVMTVLRLALMTACWVAGVLDVFLAVAITVALPTISGLVYVVLLARPPTHLDQPVDEPGIARALVRYGSQVWVGSVASMLLSRMAPLVMTPLSSAADLGLFTVATTISDVPLLVALAIQGALFGVSSRDADSTRAADTSRLTLLAGIFGCAIIGGTLPFWIQPLFGPDFAGATIPTVMLLASAVVCIPGLMAAGALSGSGRPALRSIRLAFALIANLGLMILLVPVWGVYGACWASVVSNVVLTAFMVGIAARVMKIRWWSFVAPTLSDLRRLTAEFTRALSLIGIRPKAAPDAATDGRPRE